MLIRKYTKLDEKAVMALITQEGEEWACYYDDEHQEAYKKNLEKSITYLAIDQDKVVGYARAIEDYGFYIYVCDLLVSKSYRGNHIGKQLMESFYEDYPNLTVFVMSDVDAYYQTLGYHQEGHIFEVKRPKK
jgi:ribosomal protein S18 acetylase RimI-like enzyme